MPTPQELKQLAYDMIKLRGSTFLGEELKELWLERLSDQATTDQTPTKKTNA